MGKQIALKGGCKGHKTQDRGETGPKHDFNGAAFDDFRVKHHECRDQIEALGKFPCLKTGFHGTGVGNRRPRKARQCNRRCDVTVLRVPEHHQMRDQKRNAKFVRQCRADQHDQNDVGCRYRQTHAKDQAGNQNQNKCQNNVTARKRDHH